MRRRERSSEEGDVRERQRLSLDPPLSSLAQWPPSPTGCERALCLLLQPILRQSTAPGRPSPEPFSRHLPWPLLAWYWRQRRRHSIPLLPTTAFSLQGLALFNMRQALPPSLALPWFCQQIAKQPVTEGEKVHTLVFLSLSPFAQHLGCGKSPPALGLYLQPNRM